MWMAVGVLGYVLFGSIARIAQALGLLAGLRLLHAEWAIAASGAVAQTAVWLGTIWFCVRLASGRMPGKDWLRRRWQRRWACATDLALITVLLLAGRLASSRVPVWAFRYLTPAQLPPVALTTGLASLAWTVVLPIALMVVFFRLRNKGAGLLRED